MYLRSRPSLRSVTLLRDSMCLLLERHFQSCPPVTKLSSSSVLFLHAEVAWQGEPKEVLDLVEFIIRDCSNLRFAGLMTIG